MGWRRVLEAKASGGWSEAYRRKAERVVHLEDLISTLWLYTGRHTETQLTTEQKELYADVVDAHHRREFPDDSPPVERWWR